MSNSEVLSSPKPFNKRSHRPWHTDLLEDDDSAIVTSQPATVPIIENTATTKKKPHAPTADKGRMLIGGFFKPEGLLPDFLSTLPETESLPIAEQPHSMDHPSSAPEPLSPKTPLSDQIREFSEKWENISVVEPNPSAHFTPQSQETMVDLNNTEALLETILKAKQQEVEKLSEHAFSRVKAMELKLATAEDARNNALREREVAETKLSKIILKIQENEESKNEEMKKRRIIEAKIHEIIKESEIIKQQAEEQIENAKLNAQMQEEARIVAEKSNDESLEKLAQYTDIIKEAEILSEKYKQQSEALANMQNLQLHAEAGYQEAQEQLTIAHEAQRYAEEQFCNLKLEIDTERAALQFKSDHLQEEIADKTSAMQTIIEKERELRVILETKLQKLFKKYLELDKGYQAEQQARQLAEQRTKQAIEQASKAVMHVLSVSNTGAA